MGPVVETDQCHAGCKLEVVTTPAYAGAARRAFAECVDVAERFAELKTKRDRRRIHQLTTAFIGRFFGAMNVAPVLADRRRQEARLDAEEEELREALEIRADSPPPDLEVDDVELRDAVATLEGAIGDEKHAAALKMLADRVLVADMDRLLAEINCIQTVRDPRTDRAAYQQ